MKYTDTTVIVHQICSHVVYIHEGKFGKPEGHINLQLNCGQAYASL